MFLIKNIFLFFIKNRSLVTRRLVQYCNAFLPPFRFNTSDKTHTTSIHRITTITMSSQPQPFLTIRLHTLTPHIKLICFILLILHKNSFILMPDLHLDNFLLLSLSPLIPCSTFMHLKHLLFIKCRFFFFIIFAENLLLF